MGWQSRARIAKGIPPKERVPREPMPKLDPWAMAALVLMAPHRKKKEAPNER